MKLFLKGARCFSDKCAFERRGYAPGEHGKSRRIKETNYGQQLREKQKARRIYGLLERQFRHMFNKAALAKGVTGEVLLQMLERRLDNVVFRLGLAPSRSAARQLVRHGHVRVNGLRRVLLSSLQGAAITAVRIDGVLHEFSTLPGVIEDVTEIILNLKQVRLKLHGDGPKKGTFEMRGKNEVRAADLKVDAEVQVLNPDLHLATLNRDGDMRMEVEINGGRGYVSADQHSLTDRPIGVIPIDSLFSPV